MNRNLLIKTMFFFALMAGACTVSAQKYRWVATMGSNGLAGNAAVVRDGHGFLYTVGDYSDTIHFDPPGDTLHSTTTASYRNAYLAKYDTAGRLVWAKRIGSGKHIHVAHLALDPAGHLLVAGGFHDTVYFKTTTGTVRLETGIVAGFNSAMQTFVGKLDTSGTALWVKHIGSGSMGNTATRVTADQSGNVIVAGIFSDTVDLDPGPGRFVIVGSNSGVDIFVVKLASDGTFRWGCSAGAWWADSPQGIATDDQDAIYLSGYFGGTVDFDPGPGIFPLTAWGTEDAFLWKLNSDGTLAWAKKYGGPDWDDLGMGMVRDAAGHIYMTGSFRDSIYFGQSGPHNLYSYGGRDAFLCKLDPQGDPVWTRNMGGKGRDHAYDIGMDAAGHLYITGHFSDTATFGTEKLVSRGGTDVFVCKADQHGDILWARGFGGKYASGIADNSSRIVVEPTGDVYVSGYFRDTCDFDPGAGTAIRGSYNGTADGFLLKLLCADDKQVFISDTACNSYTFQGQTFSSTGRYELILQSASGCDSAYVSLDLTIRRLDKPVITPMRDTLTVAGTYSSYQWLKNDTAIAGETGPRYVVFENAAYRVAVTGATGCIDTSGQFVVSNLAVYTTQGQQRFVLYPNPARSELHIRGAGCSGISVTDMNGRAVPVHFRSPSVIDIRHLVPGMYLVRFTGPDGELLQAFTFMKEGT